MSSEDRELAAAAADLGQRLHARELRLATAESCTGGWIAKAMTDVAGSSQWFEGGLVTYSNALKTALLGVPAAMLGRFGAVSEPVVALMARGARVATGCGAAVAVSGVAGPDGGTPEKPVGLVWFGFDVENRAWTVQQHFEGDREAVRRATVAFALQQLAAFLDD